MGIVEELVEIWPNEVCDTFLCKKSDAIEAIKAVFQLWLNTTSHSVKCLHTDNRGEYMISELQSFLHEQGIVHETSIPYVH